MSDLDNLIEMGFPPVRVKKALAAIRGGGLEQAMEWLIAHEDDQGIDDESEVDAATNADEAMAETSTSENPKEIESAKSIKCDECGKLFGTSEQVEFHAVKSGHSGFSESTEEKKPLTEEEKKLKLIEVEERLKQRRKEKELEEQKEARDREKKRVNMGRQIAESRRKMQEDEIRRCAEERRREKIDDQKARQKIKDKIEQDKIARKAMFASPGTQGANSPVPESSITCQPIVVVASTEKKEYSKTKLQIRLPTGAPMVNEFGAKESLSNVRLFVQLNRQDGRDREAKFTLSTNYPKKTFTEEDMEKPLDVLGLVPSAVLMMTNIA